MPQTNDPKPDEPQGVKRADAGLTSAHERIETAKEELARLDRLVSGMERGDGPPIRQRGTGAEPSGAPASEAPSSQNTSGNKAPQPGVKQGRPMLLALVGFWLAVCIVGAAFASKAIVARWAPPDSIAHKEASEPPGSTGLVLAQAADAPAQPSPPPAPSQKETKDVPSTGATTSVDQTSTDLAQSLKTITHDLASISEKLDQLKSSYDQTLREHAGAIQQLKTAQQQSARDNARIAEQVQALQAQLAASSAKPPVQSPSPVQSPKKENDVAARPRQSVVASPRPRRPPERWRPRSYMDDPWDDPYW